MEIESESKTVGLNSVFDDKQQKVWQNDISKTFTMIFKTYEISYEIYMSNCLTLQ